MICMCLCLVLLTALLLVDGVALKKALDLLFPKLPLIDHEILLDAFVATLEGTYGLSFRERYVLHDLE